MKISISTRLALYYGISLSLILCVFVLYLYTSFHVGLHDEFRKTLQSDEIRFRNLVTMTGQAPSFEAPISDGDVHVRLLGESGQVLHESATFRQRGGFVPAVPASPREDIVNTSWMGHPTQSLYAPLSDEAGTHVGWLEITRLESGMHRELHRLGWLLSMGILAGLVLALGSGHWLARRALKPIATITQAAREIQAESPEKRLPDDFGIRDEITDLAETLNSLLGRLEASLDRERRFRADAAHQMFTPLTAIQSEVEIALRKERSVEDYRDTLGRIQNQSKNLSQLIDGLLRLSHAESVTLASGEACNLGAVLISRLSPFEAHARRKNIQLHRSIPEDLNCSVPLEHVCMVIDNLLENALKYTPDGGFIKLSIYLKKESLCIDIADSGIGITSDEQERIFDRFYRSSRQEVAALKGAGLGLSIVQAIVQAYGGSISAVSHGPDQGSVFSVWLPSAA